MCDNKNKKITLYIPGLQFIKLNFGNKVNIFIIPCDLSLQEAFDELPVRWTKSEPWWQIQTQLSHHTRIHRGSFTEKPSKSFTQKHTHTQEALLRNPVKALLKNYLRKKTGTERWMQLVSVFFFFWWESLVLLVFIVLTTHHSSGKLFPPNFSNKFFFCFFLGKKTSQTSLIQ